MARFGARKYGGGIPTGGGGIICIRQLPTYYWRESRFSHGLSRCFLPFSMMVAGDVCCVLGCLSSPYCVVFAFPSLIDWVESVSDNWTRFACSPVGVSVMYIKR